MWVDTANCGLALLCSVCVAPAKNATLTKGDLGLCDASDGGRCAILRPTQRLPVCLILGWTLGLASAGFVIENTALPAEATLGERRARPHGFWYAPLLEPEHGDDSKRLRLHLRALTPPSSAGFPGPAQ